MRAEQIKDCPDEMLTDHEERQKVVDSLKKEFDALKLELLKPKPEAAKK